MSDTQEKSKSYKIKINTPDVGYEPFPVSIINRSTSEATSFDPALGKPATISYKLTKAGTIRLRIVRRDNPEVLLLTLQDWTDKEFGEHRVEWDGRDASGNIIDNKKVLVLFEAKDQAFERRHEDHDPPRCRDPKLVIETVPDSHSDVKGVMEIRTSFAPEEDISGWNSGCEVRYFVDYKLLKRESFDKVQDVFSFKLDTAGLSDGEHFITVNVNDFNDHTGTAGIRIDVRNQP